MILVTGATGTIGSEVVRLLAGRGVRVRAMTRKPTEAAGLAAEVVGGDFDEPASLGAAVAGVEAVFLLTAPGPAVAAHDLALLDAVRAHGVRRVVKLSAIGTGDDSGLAGNAWHLPGEQALRAGEAEWTILRPTTFASNSLHWAPAIRAGHPVPNMSGTGTQGVVDPRDVAEAAVRALTAPGHTGRTYTLTGPELLSVPDQVEVLSGVLGRRVDVLDVPLHEARDAMIAAGASPEFAEAAMAGQRYVAEGRNARRTDDVATLLGRPPRTYATWAADHREAFGG